MTRSVTLARIAGAVLSLSAAGALGACGSSSSTTTARSPTRAASRGVTLASGCRASHATDQVLNTATHVFLLHVGPPETMVMRGEAQASHIKSGEVMIGGSMAEMSSAAGMSMRHLEVHICDRASGKVVANTVPTITLDRSPGGKPEQVPVMVMEGIGAGTGDLHYGNNVPLHPVASYVVTVRLGADRAVFRFTSAR